MAFLTSNGASGADSAQEACAGLRLVNSLTEFAKVAEVCAEPHEFCQLAVSLFQVPNASIQQEAATLLLTIASQKLLPHEIPLLQQLMGTVSANPINPTILSQDLEERLVFLRTYAEGLYGLCSWNIAMCLDDAFLKSEMAGGTGQAGQVLLGHYFTCMVQILSEPGQGMGADCVNLWSKILSHPHITKLDWIGEVVALLLKTYSRKAERAVIIDECFISETDEIEFDELDEYVEFFATYKNQIKLLGEIAAKRFPLVTSQFVLEQANALIAISALTPEEEQAGTVGVDSQAVRTWDGLLNVWGLMFSKVGGSSGKDCHSHKGGGCIATASAHNPVIGQNYAAAVEAILTWDSEQGIPIEKRAVGQGRSMVSALRSVRVRAIQESAPLLKLSPHHLAAAVAAIFETFGQFDPSDPTPGSAKVSKHTAAALSHLCDACSDTIAASPDLLSELVPRLIGGLSLETHLPQEDKACIGECLVALSEKVPNKDDRSQMLSAALTTPLHALQSAAESFLSSPQALLQCIGEQASMSISISIDTQGNTQGTPSSRKIAELARVLSGLAAAAKRVCVPMLPLSVWQAHQPHPLSHADLLNVFPFLQVWDQLLPLVLTVSRSLHGLWEGEVRAVVAHSNPAASEIFAPTYDQARHAAKSDNKVGGASQSALSAGSLVSVTSQWLESKSGLELVRCELLGLRSHLYVLLGLACTHKAVYVSPLRQQLISEFVQSQRCMENVHLSLFFSKFCEPFVLNCPPCFYSDITIYLSQTLTDTLARLSLAWDRDNTNNTNTNNGVNGAKPTMEQSIYRHCSLGPEYAGLDSDGAETAKEAMIAEVTRNYSDILSSFGLCRGYLAVSYGQSAVAIGDGDNDISLSNNNNKNNNNYGNNSTSKKSGKKGQGGGGSNKGSNKGSARVKPHAKSVPLAVGSIAGASEADTDDARIAQKSARQQSMLALMLGQHSNSTARPYVASIVALICIPDSQACRSGLRLAANLYERRYV